MRHIAHITNPVVADPSSDLSIAQPITFKTMRAAKEYARGHVKVSLLSAQFPEDQPIVPDFFVRTPDLDRSVLDLGTFLIRRKLPLLQDILERLYHAASDAEYCIYTNVDIALQPSFYVSVDQIIDQGYEAFAITRRTLPMSYHTPADIPLMYAQLGVPHPGTDCFVFKRALYPQLYLANACIGALFLAKNFQLNLICNTTAYKKFTDLHLTFHLDDNRPWQAPELDDYQRHNEQALRNVLTHYAALGVLPDRFGFSERLWKNLRVSQRTRVWRRSRLTRLMLRLFQATRTVGSPARTG